MKYCLLILALLGCNCAFATERTPLSQLKFADPVMEKCVNNAAAMAGVNSVEKLDFVQCRVSGPISLAGLGQLPALESLIISGGDIKDIAALKQAPKLNMVMFNRGHIDKFSTIGNHNLDVVLNDMTANDWRQLKQLHVSSISIQHPKTCREFTALAHDSKVSLLTQNSSATDLANGMQTSANPRSDKTVVMLDCPRKALM